MLYQTNIGDQIASFIYSLFTYPFVQDRTLTFDQHYNDQLIYKIIENSYRNKDYINGVLSNNDVKVNLEDQNSILTKINELSDHGRNNLSRNFSQIKTILLQAIATAGHDKVLNKIHEIDPINQDDIDIVNSMDFLVEITLLEDNTIEINNLANFLPSSDIAHNIDQQAPNQTLTNTNPLTKDDKADTSNNIIQHQTH